MCSNLELVDIEKSRRPLKDSLINDEERSVYRSLLGQLLWVAQHTRADVACAVSEHAQRTNCTTVADQPGEACCGYCRAAPLHPTRPC